jgi:MarR family transcriptional regulator for hemolysin
VAISNFEVYRQGGSTPDIKLTVALVLVARRWRALVDERLRPLGQSSARMEALSAIMNSPDPSSQVVIANRLRVEGPTMTRMIDALSRDGLMERRAAPADRRTKYLSLTEKGKAALEEIFAVTDPMREVLLEGLTPEDLTRLHQVLKVMLFRLDAGLPPSDAAEAEQKG